MNNHDGTADHTAHGGGFLPADAGRSERRAARKAWRAAAQGLVTDQIDRAAAAKRAETAARNAEYRSRTPKAGEKRPWAGRTARPLRVRQHRVTTANLAFAYPFLADGGLGSSGIYIGRDSHSGASFCYCGFDLYNRRPRLVSNTNMLIAGNIGWGKTNTAMAIAVRNIPFGRRIVVPGDPKDDWLRLALALGGQGIRLGRGLQARLNPLDGGVKPPDKDHAVWDSEVRDRRQKLLIGLVATAAPAIAPLEPLAVAALDLALAAEIAANGAPTLPQVAHHLGNPDEQRAIDAGYSADLLRERGQPEKSRSTALFQLATDLPAAILSRMLGIHITVAVSWQRASAATGPTYAAGRVDAVRSAPFSIALLSVRPTGTHGAAGHHDRGATRSLGGRATVFHWPRTGVAVSVPSRGAAWAGKASSAHGRGGCCARWCCAAVSGSAVTWANASAQVWAPSTTGLDH